MTADIKPSTTNKWPCGTCGRDVSIPSNALLCREHYTKTIADQRQEIEGFSNMYLHVCKERDEARGEHRREKALKKVAEAVVHLYRPEDYPGGNRACGSPSSCVVGKTDADIKHSEHCLYAQALAALGKEIP